MTWKKWVGENLSLGGIIKHTTSAAGTVSKYTLKAVGRTAEFVGNQFNSDIGKSINSGCQIAGDVCDSALTTGGKYLGHGVNKSIEVAGVVTGEAVGLGFELAGAEEKTVANAKKVATVVGAAGLGLVAGVGAANAAVSMAAAAGTTGAAATSSGLAALGGGSIAAGGGGMAAGQAVTSAISAAGAASGGATLIKDDETENS